MHTALNFRAVLKKMKWKVLKPLFLGKESKNIGKTRKSITKLC